MKTLWQRGRLTVVFEPGDLWVGLFYDRKKHLLYATLVPTIVFRWGFA